MKTIVVQVIEKHEETGEVITDLVREFTGKRADSMSRTFLERINKAKMQKAFSGAGYSGKYTERKILHPIGVQGHNFRKKSYWDGAKANKIITEVKITTK